MKERYTGEYPQHIRLHFLDTTSYTEK